MKGIKAWVRAFFGFSRTETSAFLILIPLMFVLIFSEPVYRYWFVRQPHDYSKEKQQLDSLLATWKWERDTLINGSGNPERELFAFNPNRSTKEELISLGFNQALANRIVNYRAKGGKFLVKRDLMKVYGMDSVLFEELTSYINLPDNISKEKPTPKFEKKENSSFTKFDLNKADTSQLISIYGIGQKLSLRIVAYREKLGGFILESQLNEVYGLDSVVVKELLAKSFIIENFQPKQININQATEKELGSHPYVKYKLAKAIIAYRKQHGDFNSVDELKKVAIMEESILQKMKPYLLVEK